MAVLLAERMGPLNGGQGGGHRRMSVADKRRTPPRTIRFTMVEMLVVIAIILILMSLILPSFRRAVHQSRLVRCASNLSQLGKAVSAYADDNFGHYPRRTVNQLGKQPYVLYANKESLWGPTRDDRPMLMPYTEINTILVCPLSPLEDGVSLTGSLADASWEIWSSYDLWFGSEYDKRYPGVGLFREGVSPPDYLGNNFNVLAADLECVCEGMEGGHYWVASAHPDFKLLQHFKKTTSGDKNVWGMIMSLWINGWWTNPDDTSKWKDPANLSRGGLDRNFLTDDGAVYLLTDLSPNDPRMVRLPSYSSNPELPLYSSLPLAK